jgi:hypothetical protein
MPAQSDNSKLSNVREPSKPELVEKLYIVEDFGDLPELDS